MIQKTIITLANLSRLDSATPIPDFDIKAVLALPQYAQLAMYESLTKQCEVTTDEEKEAFWVFMRERL
jgi:hypothetical protein